MHDLIKLENKSTYRNGLTYYYYRPQSSLSCVVVVVCLFFHLLSRISMARGLIFCYLFMEQR